MIKRLSLFLSLFLPVCLLAETVPALVIGGETKVPPSDIVSVKVDADSLYVLKADGIIRAEFTAQWCCHS